MNVLESVSQYKDRISAELDNKLRSQIFAELFDEWLKKQVESVEVLIDLDLNSKLIAA